MEMDELAAELAALKGNLAQRDQMDTQRGFIDKYGSKFSGDEGIGVAILGELGRRGIDTSAADEAVQEILDNIRMEATAILDKIKGEQSAVSDLMDKMNTVEESIEAASGAMPDAAGAEVGMPPEGAPPPEPGMSPEMEGAMPPEEGGGEAPPPEEGGGEAPPPPPEMEGAPPEGEVSDRRMKYILSDEDLKEVFNAEDDDLEEIKAMLAAKSHDDDDLRGDGSNETFEGLEELDDDDGEEWDDESNNNGYSDRDVSSTTDFPEDEEYEYEEVEEGDGDDPEGVEETIDENNLEANGNKMIGALSKMRADAGDEEGEDYEGYGAKNNHLVEALMGMLH